MNQVPLVQVPSQKQEVVARTPTTEALEMQPHIERLSRTPPTAQAIPRWKQMIITLVPAYIGSTLFGLALFALLPGWPFAVINLFMNLFLVLMLTYVAGPAAQHWLADWLYAPPQLSQGRAARRRSSVARRGSRPAMDSQLSQGRAARRRRRLRHVRLPLVPVSLWLRRLATSRPAFQLLVRRCPQKLIARAHLSWAPARVFRATISLRIIVHKGEHV